jgi:hypothetical protein
MAPLPTIADTYRVVFRWTQDSVVNVTHIHAAASVPNDVWNAINGHVTANMWAASCTNNKVSSVDITPLFSNGATQTFVTDGSAKWTGVQSAAGIPNSALVLSQHTLFRGPANRGRLFLGPISEDSQTDGVIATTIRGACVVAWTAFGVALVAASMEHVVASYKHATALTIVNYSARAASGTQRRRQSRLAA